MRRVLMWLNLYGCETGKKCIFGVFRPILILYRTASRPYTLSHINALRINQSYQPKDQSMKFSWKNIENWRSWKMRFFWVGHFDFFFLHLSEKSSPFIWGIIFFCTMDGFQNLGKEVVRTFMHTTVHNKVLLFSWFNLF